MAVCRLRGRSRLHQRCCGKRHRGGQFLLDDAPAHRTAITDQSLAAKWGSGTPGTGADVTYAFAAASDWTASEKAAWQGGLALWSAVADIKFIAAADAASANFVIMRGNDGAFARYVATGHERRSAPAPSVVPESNRLDSSQVDTNALGFGPIGQDLAARGGYPLLDGRARDRPHDRPWPRRPVQRRRRRDGVPARSLRHAAMVADVLHQAHGDGRQVTSTSIPSAAPTGDQSPMSAGTGAIRR